MAGGRGITVLFTDMKGSTSRHVYWETAPEAMRVAMDRHNALLTDVISAQGGRVILERGDADGGLDDAEATKLEGCRPRDEPRPNEDARRRLDTNRVKRATGSLPEAWRASALFDNATWWSSPRGPKKEAS